MENTGYQVKGLDDNFHTNNFMLKYKKYIDLQTYKENKEMFLKVLSKVEVEVRKIENIQKNTLFICNDNISKYIFLSALSTLPRLVSERHMNLIDLVDIWYGQGRSTNIRKEDDESIYSEQDIREDVVCVYMDKSMFTGKSYGGIFNSFVSSRSDRVNLRRENLYTWSFYRGTIESLRTHDIAKCIYEHFTSDPIHYQIVDFSMFNGILSGTENNNGSFTKPTVITGIPTDSGYGKSLEDVMY
jgi:hypothetical protein